MKKKIALSRAVGSPELQIRRSKGYFSTEFLKISIEIEAEGVKILKVILDFSIEIKFRG